MNTYLTASELAQRLHVKTATIHAWHRRGWIPGMRAGRRPVLFDIDDVLYQLRQRGASPNASRRFFPEP